VFCSSNDDLFGARGNIGVASGAMLAAITSIVKA